MPYTSSLDFGPYGNYGAMDIATEGVSNMPAALVAPAVISAGIGAAGSIAGGLIQSHSQNKATNAQMQANREALAYQKEQEALKQANYQRRYDAWNTSRNALLKRYGIDIGTPTPVQSAAVQPQMGAAQPTNIPRTGMGGVQTGMTIGDMVARKRSVSPQDTELWSGYGKA